MEVRNVKLAELEFEISNLERVLQKDNIELLITTSDNYQAYIDGYARIIEYLWNQGSANPELFPKERLIGRIEYFRDLGVFLHTILLRYGAQCIGLYETVFYQTNKYVADESICGMISEYSSHVLMKIMKLKALHYIICNTEVTHWESPIQDNQHPLFKINEDLGFVLGKSYDHYEIPRD